MVARETHDERCLYYAMLLQLRIEGRLVQQGSLKNPSDVRLQSIIEECKREDSIQVLAEGCIQESWIFFHQGDMHSWSLSLERAFYAANKSGNDALICRCLYELAFFWNLCSMYPLFVSRTQAQMPATCFWSLVLPVQNLHC